MLEHMTTTTTARPRTAHSQHRHHHERGFWTVGFAYVVMMAAGGAPAPLYVIYQRRDHFGTAMLTVAFAAYAVGVLISLLLAGHVSDALGRRRVLIPSIALQFAGAAVFLASPSLAGLLTGRVLSGLAVGVMTSTATAHMTELHLRARPGTSVRRAELTTTAANLGGLALGPLFTGFLAEWAPSPLRLPYLILMGLLLVAALGVIVAPETREPTGQAYRPQRLAMPAQGRGAYLAAMAGGIVSFALFGLFMAMVPSFLAGSLHHTSHALAGAVAFAGLAAGAFTQTVVRRSLRQTVALAGILPPLGLLLLTGSVWEASLWGFVTGGIIAGAGAGLLFKASVGSVIAMAAPGTRAELLTGFFVASYTGLAVSSVGIGVAAQHLDPRAVLTAFAAVCLLGLAVAVRFIIGQAS